jgi:thiol:disulfide interchange protein DsbC
MAPKKTGLVEPIYRPLIGCILFALSSSLWAQLAVDALERLSNFLPGINAAMVEPAPFPGIYQIKYGLDFYYISADGDYLIAGNLMELSTGLNLTEESRKSVRLEVIDQIDPQEKIIFAAKDQN